MDFVLGNDWEFGSSYMQYVTFLGMEFNEAVFCSYISSVSLVYVRIYIYIYMDGHK